MAGTNLGTAYVTIMPSAKGISGSMRSALSGEAESAGRSAGIKFGTAMKVAIAAAAVGIGKFIKDSIDAGGELQQSFGGLDTIYGEAAEGMKDLAYEASKAGISANTYAEQAVSFGASLKQAYGSDLKGAANAANTAILDMADNSAKMGTDITMIQNAYQGFAKQNYTMLDNLKLGYGGTKKEMQRLLADADALNAKQGKTTKYSLENLGDVYEAIHVVQGELGITGVAAAEAEGTFTGSTQAMKAAWQNLKADMALGNDISKDLEVVAVSAKNFLTNNLLPMIGNVLKSLPSLIAGFLKSAFENMPGAIEGAKNFLINLTQGIKDGGGEFFEGIKELALAGIEAFKNTDWIGLGGAIIDLIWTGITTLAPLLWQAFLDLASAAAEWFQSVDWGAVGTNIVTFIADAIIGIGNLIWDALLSIGSTAKEWFEGIDWSNAGANAFHALVDGLSAIGSTLWEAIKKIGADAAEKFKSIDWPEVGRTVITAICNGIKAIGSFIWEALSTIGTKATEFFKNVDWRQAGDTAMTFIINAIKNLGSALWTALKAIGQTAATMFKSINWPEVGRSVINFIVSALKAVGNLIWGALTAIGREAWNGFKNLSWVQAGMDIINGIVSGIYNAGASIVNAIVGFAQSAWSSIKAFFGISSPSKLMRDTVGKWIPLGIAAGIEQEAGAVTDAMLDIAEEASTTIDPKFGMDATYSALSSGPATAGSTIAINVYPSAGMDEMALADMIQQKLVQLQQQRNAVWGIA